MSFHMLLNHNNAKYSSVLMIISSLHEVVKEVFAS